MWTSPGEWAHWVGVEAPVRVEEHLGETWESSQTQKGAGEEGAKGQRRLSWDFKETPLCWQCQTLEGEHVSASAKCVPGMYIKALGTDPTVPQVEDRELLLCWRSTYPMG